MKSTAIACVITAASLGFGSLSYAQGYDRGNRDGRRHDQAAYPAQQRQFEQRQQQRQQFNHPGLANQYGHQGQWSARTPQYAPQYRSQYHRGDHLPYQFRQRQYYVNDWRAHHLYAPPYGYQWVQNDDTGDFLLVALATGLIANLLLNQY